MKLTDNGHIKICEGMQAQTFWLAWGTAGGDMSGTDEVLTSTELIQEVGRTKQTYNSYVEPTGSGSISVAGQNWSVSATPTKYLYLKFQFPQDANTDKVIRQKGLFTNVDLTAGHEALTYIDTSTDENAFMDDKGTLIEIMNQADLTRDSSTEENYDIIITF